jgi:hypothetical protein
MLHAGWAIGALLTRPRRPRCGDGTSSMARIRRILLHDPVTRRRFTSPSGSSGLWNDWTREDPRLADRPVQVDVGVVNVCGWGPWPNGAASRAGWRRADSGRGQEVRRQESERAHMHCAASGFGMAGWTRCRRTNRRGCFRGETVGARDLDRRGTPLDRQGARPGVGPRDLDRLR